MSIHLTLDDLQPCSLSDGKTVMTTVTNYGYLLYTLNMLKSLAPFGLDKKVLVVCIDKKGAAVLKRFGYSVYCIDDDGGGSTRLSKFCPWNTKGYDKICYLKLELLYRILSLKKNVLLIDGDIVFQKDPMEDIRKWYVDRTSDVWIQNDAKENQNTTNMCTGYMFIRTCDKLIKLYDCVSELGQKKYMTCAFDNNDQSYFNKFVKPECIMSPLPLEKYPNGKMFYDNTELVRPTAVLVHFNWVHGHLKMAKMKEHKMWLLTPEEEEEI
jgi:hypothetical protein